MAAAYLAAMCGMTAEDIVRYLYSLRPTVDMHDAAPGTEISISRFIEMNGEDFSSSFQSAASTTCSRTRCSLAETWLLFTSILSGRR